MLPILIVKYYKSSSALLPLNKLGRFFMIHNASHYRNDLASKTSFSFGDFNASYSQIFVFKTLKILNRFWTKIAIPRSTNVLQFSFQQIFQSSYFCFARCSVWEKATLVIWNRRRATAKAICRQNDFCSKSREKIVASFWQAPNCESNCANFHFIYLVK